MLSRLSAGYTVRAASRLNLAITSNPLVPFAPHISVYLSPHSIMKRGFVCSYLYPESIVRHRFLNYAGTGFPSYVSYRSSNISKSSADLNLTIALPVLE